MLGLEEKWEIKHYGSKNISSNLQNVLLNLTRIKPVSSVLHTVECNHFAFNLSTELKQQ